MANYASSDEPVNLLALDGGGIRGVSELVVLNAIMKRLQQSKGLDSLPRPCEYFHLLGGTSTGGLVALMLGPFGMTTAEAIEAYRKLSKEVFSKKNLQAELLSRFSEHALEKIVKEMVAKQTSKSRMLDMPSHAGKGLAFVCSLCPNRPKEPILLRTYPHKRDESVDCQVWQAARATTAAPMFFRPMQIKFQHGVEDLVDGAFQWNNPSSEVLQEAKSLFDPERRLGVFLSLGTGVKEDSNLWKTSAAAGGHSYNFRDLMRLCTNLLTDTHRVHVQLQETFHAFPETYFRFNVTSGADEIKLHHWKKIEQMITLTESYIAKSEISAQIDEVVRILSQKKSAGWTFNGTAQGRWYQQSQRPTIPSPLFTGQVKILQELDDAFFAAQQDGLPKQRHVRLVGMGGIGKTQIALKFIEGRSTCFDQVFWVDASRNETIEQGLSDIGATILVGDARTSDFKQVIRWFQDTTENWLLVFDNYDQGNIEPYLPMGRRGNVLYTSRRDDLPPKHLPQLIRVPVMGQEDAITFMLKAAELDQDSPDLRAEAKRIVEILGCLPLAIDQAGSYVSNEICSLAQYETLFLRRKMELMSQPLFSGSSATNPAVYATFDISYHRLKTVAEYIGDSSNGSRRALQILNTFCFYHNEGLTGEIIERAALSTNCHRELIGEYELGGDVFPPKELLNLDRDGTWDFYNFQHGMSVLRSYSLIKREMSYSMHILVHSWARDRMSEPVRQIQLRAARFVIFDSFPEKRDKERTAQAFRTKMLPHATACRSHELDIDIGFDENMKQDSKYVRILTTAGRWPEAIEVLKEIIRKMINKFGQDDKDTHAAMRSLASAYSENGDYAEAEDLLRQILELKDLPPIDPQYLGLKADIAKVLRLQGQYDMAERDYQEILDVLLATLPQDDPSVVKITRQLALVHMLQGQTEESKEMELDAARRYLQENPGDLEKTDGSALKALHYKSTILAHECRFAEAIPIQEKILQINEEVYGRESPYTIAALTNLGIFYGHLQQWTEAERYHNEAVEAARKMWGSDHPMTLEIMASFVEVICDDRPQQARDLIKEVYERRLARLGATHPLTDEARKSYETIDEVLETTRSQNTKIKEIIGTLREMNLEVSEELLERERLTDTILSGSISARKLIKETAEKDMREQEEATQLLETPLLVLP